MYCVLAVPRQVTYADLGGIEGVLSDIRELIEHPLQHPEVSIMRVNQFPPVLYPICSRNKLDKTGHTLLVMLLLQH